MVRIRNDNSIEGKKLWITVSKDLPHELSYEDPNKDVNTGLIIAIVASVRKNAGAKGSDLQHPFLSRPVLECDT